MVDIRQLLPYIIFMIKSFRSKALKAFWIAGESRYLPPQLLARTGRILDALDVAQRAEDMNVPGYYFHGLKGRAKGRYSVRLSANWRITFAFEGHDAIDVDMEDYH